MQREASLQEATSSSSSAPRCVQFLVGEAIFCLLYLVALIYFKGSKDRIRRETSSETSSMNNDQNDSLWLGPEARMMTPTGSSNYWFLVAALLAASSLHSYQRLYIPLKPRGLALLGLVISLTCVIPFLVYLYTGVSWSGMEMSELHRRMIDSRHAILLFTWSGLSSLQLLGILVMLPKSIHKWVGLLAYYFVMPLVLLELNTNAVRVFLPEKPALLCRAVWGIAEPNLWETLIFGLSQTYALLLPAMMGMYWWLALQSIRSHKYHLHMVYSVLLSATTSSPGGLRYLFQYVYATSRCEPFRSPETSILVQSVSLAMITMVFIPLVTMIYCTLPLDIRQGKGKGRPTVQWSYYFYIGHALTTLVVSGLVGIPSSFTCHPLLVPQDDSIFSSSCLDLDACNLDDSSNLGMLTNLE
jgi:hypothetical protein